MAVADILPPEKKNASTGQSRTSASSGSSSSSSPRISASRISETPRRSEDFSGAIPHKYRQLHENLRTLREGAHPQSVRHGDFRRIIIQGARELAGKLNAEIAKGNDTGAYMIALLLAGFKDFLDVILNFTGVGEIPGVNFGCGLFLTSFLFYFMLSKGYFLTTRLRIWFWVLGLFVDGLPLFSTLPINLLLVLYAWRLAKKRAANAEINLRDLQKLSQKEVDALNKNISLLENSS